MKQASASKINNSNKNWNYPFAIGHFMTSQLEEIENIQDLETKMSYQKDYREIANIHHVHQAFLDDFVVNEVKPDGSLQNNTNQERNFNLQMNAPNYTTLPIYDFNQRKTEPRTKQYTYAHIKRAILEGKVHVVDSTRGTLTKEQQIRAEKNRALALQKLQQQRYGNQPY